MFVILDNPQLFEWCLLSKPINGPSRIIRVDFQSRETKLCLCKRDQTILSQCKQATWLFTNSNYILMIKQASRFTLSIYIWILPRIQFIKIDKRSGFSRRCLYSTQLCKIYIIPHVQQAYDIKNIITNTNLISVQSRYTL